MRLHGRFRHAEFVGDLFVEKAAREHHQHTDLLRRKCREPRDDRRGLGIGPLCQIDVGGRPDFALKHAPDRRAQRLDAERLRNEPRRAEFHAAPDNDRIVVARHHHDRQARILRAQVHQPRKAAHAGHGKIEQNQIEVAVTLQKVADFLERAGLGDLRAAEQPADRLTKGAAKQRMVVGDQQMMRLRFAQRDNPDRSRAGARENPIMRLVAAACRW